MRRFIDGTCQSTCASMSGIRCRPTHHRPIGHVTEWGHLAESDLGHYRLAESQTHAPVPQLPGSCDPKHTLHKAYGHLFPDGDCPPPFASPMDNQRICDMLLSVLCYERVLFFLACLYPQYRVNRGHLLSALLRPDHQHRPREAGLAVIPHDFEGLHDIGPSLG